MRGMLVIQLFLAALATAQVVDYAGAWREHFSGCSLSLLGHGVSFLQSPVELPAAANPPAGTATVAFTRNEGSPGMIYLPVVRSSTGVTVRLVHASASAVLNGTTFRAVNVRYLRPPEHVPAGTTAAEAAAMVEQQVTFRSDNTTAFVASQIFTSDAGASEVSPSAARALIDVVGVGSSAKLRPEAWDYGLRTMGVWSYQGTGAAPSCDQVRWLAGSAPIPVPPATVEQFPSGPRRETVAITAAQRTALVTLVQLSGAPPAGDALPPLVDGAPSVSNMSFTFGPRTAGALSDRVVLQTALFMLAGLCGVMALAIAVVVVLRYSYRSEERSTWVHGRHGTQYFGFGPSTLYVQDLDDTGTGGTEESDEEDFEEDG